MRSVWNLKPVEEQLKTQLSKELKISPTLAALLTQRKIKDSASAKGFLNPRLEDLHDPLLLKDADRAVQRILAALAQGEEMVVYGDADGDGVTSTAVMVGTLRDLGGKVSYHIPSRMSEGPGLKKEFIDQASDKGVKLILTVDCGVTNFEEVAYAAHLGIDVVITDHHEPLEELPPACAVVDPKRVDCSYPFKGLTGAGVAYKIAQAVAIAKLGLSLSQWHSVKGELIGLVLLGTVADRVELMGENRIFTKFGLELLTKTTRPWAKAIKKVTGTASEPPTIPTLLTTFIPILSSRISEQGTDSRGKLLLAASPEQAETLAAALYQSSQDWYQRAKEAYTRLQRREDEFSSSKIIILTDQESSPDVLGYCASRLKEQFSRPAVLIGFRDDEAVGEARAPSGFDLMGALKGCNELLLDYGGHKEAAGFSIDPTKINQLSARLGLYADEVLEWDKLCPTLEIDAEIPIYELKPKLIKEIRRLAPFGEGNPEPHLLSREVYIEKRKDGYHILGYDLIMSEDRRTLCLWPYSNNEPNKVDIVYFIDETGQIYLKDYQPSQA